jgi:hypothetical protein
MNETRFWFDEPDPKDPDDQANRAEALLQETAAIEMRQAAWHELNRWNSILLTNRDLPGFLWGCANATATTRAIDMGPVDLRSENLIESIGESMVSKASSSPLKPTPVPHGRSYKVERAIRLVDQFQFGVWMQAKAEEAAIQGFLDGYTAGIGCVRVGFDPKKQELRDESVFFDNLVIDDRECAYRTLPRTYRIRQVVPRGNIESLYGVKLYDRGKRYHQERDIGKDYEVIVEAWRLPDIHGKGGRHCVAVAGQMVIDDPWKFDWVPLAFFHWGDPISGFHPKSGIEQLVPYQVRQNSLNDAIEEAQDIVCRPRILKHSGSAIDLTQWDNRAGRIMDYAGIKPEPFNWATNIQDLYQERERNAARAFSFMGLSEAFAQADLPPQVRADSSAGIREIRNMEDARHLRRWNRYQEFRLQIARLNLLVLSTSKGADAYSVVFHGGGHRANAKTIPYEAVKEVTSDKYTWTMEATPLSMVSPGATRELVRDWSSRGMGDEGEAQRMTGGINLTRLEELEMAAYDDILRHLDILEDGGFEAPDEITNTSYGIKKVTANLLRLRNYDDVPPEVIDNHYAWILAATSIQQAAVAQQAAPISPFAPTQGVLGTSAAQAPHTVVNNMATSA